MDRAIALDISRALRGAANFLDKWSPRGGGGLNRRRALCPALRKHQREMPKSPFMFVSERGGPFTTDSFNWMVKRAGQKASFPFQVHAHMLRHAAGYKLAGDGHDTRSIQDYLGHKNIQHAVRYTELSPKRFKDFWRD
jgi:site-specific recombinase XerD